MICWTSVLYLVAFIGSQAIADTQVDFPENVNSRGGASRIVSGWQAELGQWAHQLNLRMSDHLGQVSSCGGSVIHREWGLTAAHCTAGRVFIIVRAGLVNLTQPEYMYETNEWFNHPLYNDNLPSVVQPHDVSLLKLGRRLTYSDNLRPIRLQRSVDRNNNYSGQQAIASGYGLTWTSGTSPEVLNWVYLRAVANNQCASLYGTDLIIDSTICAIYYNVTSQSTCQGDSGGPLSVIDADGKLTLIGVTSFVSGRGCHTEDPAGFIRSGHYHAWYTDITGINFDWVDWSDISDESESLESNESNGNDGGSTEESNEGSTESTEDSKETDNSNSAEESNETDNDDSVEESKEIDNSSNENPDDDKTEVDNVSNESDLDSDIKDILDDNDINAQLGGLFIAKLGGQINIRNINFYIGTNRKHSKHINVKE